MWEKIKKLIVRHKGGRMSIKMLKQEGREFVGQDSYDYFYLGNGKYVKEEECVKTKLCKTFSTDKLKGSHNVAVFGCWEDDKYMSALNKIHELESEIEKMKCCGNCDNTVRNSRCKFTDNIIDLMHEMECEGLLWRMINE